MTTIPAKWLSIATDGPPLPEVFVLCWDGRETFVEWFGSLPDAGRGVTHWLPYEMPPGATSEMHDGRRALCDRDVSDSRKAVGFEPEGLAARAEGIARMRYPVRPGG